MPNEITRDPATPPPALVCPFCDQRLLYERTILGGRGQPERWDVFRCRTHGGFEYRHRTRRLRHTDPVQH
jgi:hypothetical protein